MKKIAVLGSTGSIGKQALDVIRSFPQKFKVVGLSTGSNIDLLLKQIQEFSPKVVTINDKNCKNNLKKLLGHNDCVIVANNEKIVSSKYVDTVVIATPGLAGISPTLEAIKSGKDIALATKEVLVSAGKLIMKNIQEKGINILPIDSEHSAIWQCLKGYGAKEIAHIYLTCSGGPFLGKKTYQLSKVTPKDALKHPTWKMGNKITIDSATLMNKGFEVIEAMWLFNIPLEKIRVIIHPQSVIHSMVEFVDGSIIAQLGPSDMRLPIQYALLYPNKRERNDFKKFSFKDYQQLNFSLPDLDTFRCLALAYKAAELGGTMTAVLTAANDIAVESFLKGKLSFNSIPDIIEKTLNKHTPKQYKDIKDILEADRWARGFALSLVNKLQALIK